MAVPLNFRFFGGTVALLGTIFLLATCTGQGPTSASAQPKPTEASNISHEPPTATDPSLAELVFPGQIGNHYQTAEPRFWVRPGFRVSKVADGLGQARFLEIGAKGDLYLSRPNSGDILTLRQRNGKYEQAATFVSGLPSVHGMHYVDGWLWFTQTYAVFKARDDNQDGKADKVMTVVPRGAIPSGGGHWYRSILVGSDGFYTSIGDSGNITDESDTERQKVWKFSLDGKRRELIASGLRNTEKLRFRPDTTEVWGLDHGSDWFGRDLGDTVGRQPITDLIPPEELNRYIPGGFYGHPFIVGDRIPRIEFQNRPDIIDLAAKTIPPAWGYGSHWAGNGFAFYSGPNDVMPRDFQGDLFAAFHGSWNRQVKAGYRIERTLFDKVTGLPYGSQMIVGCLDAKGNVLARPVDVAVEPSGSLLFSCDSTGAIYRIEMKLP